MSSSKRRLMNRGRLSRPENTYFIDRHGRVRRVVVNPLEVAVGFIVDLLTKVLVCFGPNLREVG